LATGSTFDLEASIPVVLVKAQSHDQPAHQDSDRECPNQNDNLLALLPWGLTWKTQLPKQVDD
jgi:hypothetical protein